MGEKRCEYYKMFQHQETGGDDPAKEPGMEGLPMKWEASER